MSGPPPGKAEYRFPPRLLTKSNLILYNPLLFGVPSDWLRVPAYPVEVIEGAR
jgi:hypothetical protein